MRDPGEYQFVIPGACPPKGSRVPVRKGSDKTRESSKRVEPWTEGAVRAMRDHLGKPLVSFSGPVYVVPTFVLKRPKVTEFEFPTATTIGDLDKLVRCLLDAMTKAGVIEDDRFVVDLGDDNGGRPRKIWGGIERTIVRVGRMPSPRSRDCASRLPGGDWQDCRCPNPAVCGEASVGAETAWPMADISTFGEEPGTTLIEAVRPVAQNPYALLPPPAPESEFIPMVYDGKHDRMIGPTDYGVCPKCERAALKPRADIDGVECSSTTCDYWFGY